MTESKATAVTEPHPRTPGAAARGALWVALAALLGAYVAGGSGGDVATWLPIAAAGVALAAICVRVARVPEDRAAWAILAFAVGIWILGAVDTALRLGDMDAQSATFADACRVAFYPLAYVGMVQLLRRRAAGFARTLWLDGLIGAAAVAAVATGVVLPPARADTGTAGAADLVPQLVYPLGDLLLVAFVAGVMALGGWRPGRAWIVLGAAFATLAVSHGVEFLEVASGTPASGVAALLWPVGLVLVAFAAWHPSDLLPEIRLEGWSLLVAPTLFGWITVALVGYGNFARLGSVGLVLAGLTLALVMVRAGLTFRENAAIARGLRSGTAPSRDALTGLPNHRAFHEALDRETSHAWRHARELSVVVIDIDDFRAVNRAHGHEAGDSVISAVAARIAATLRTEDVLARIGGEEFACLLPSTGGQAAWRAAERARLAVASDPIEGIGRITISAGVCDLAIAAEGGELLRLANGALYWAKMHGRNVVYRYSPEAIHVLSADERADHAERSRTLSAITALARAVDAKDATTQRHSERVAAVAAAVAASLGWSPERRAKLHEAGLVHDVGKIGVPDTILRKAAPLTPTESDVMEGHAALGARIVKDVLTPEQALWVLHHHERWDGLGYPHRIAGDSIPEGAQILAVADSWDAMTADRHYRRALPPAEVVQELVDGSGYQWSPRVVDALVALWQRGRLHPAAPDRDGAGDGVHFGGRRVMERV